jgi:5-formyltetrahydrofolate cyclo-ligase
VKSYNRDIFISLRGVRQLNNEKQKVRKMIKTSLEQLSEEKRVEYTQQISAQLFDLVEWKQAKVIGITIAIPPEIPTLHMVEQAWREGKEVVIPKCHPKNKTMQFKKITSFEQLESVYSGLLEPVESTVEIAADRIDLLIVPGLAFTKEGYRLGFGGGYYDRFLSTYNGSTIALAYEYQLVEELPVELHDIPVQQIVTNNKVLRTYAH